jgi:hypothetical protein
MGKSLFVLIRENVYLTRFILVFTALVMFVSWLTPLMAGRASAAGQLTQRSLALSSAKPGATSVQYTYTFTQPTVGNIQSIKFVACTSAFQTYAGVASCGGASNVPTGLSIQAGSQVGTLSGNWQDTTGFTRDATGANNCQPGTDVNILCIKRTANTTNETATSKSITWNGQTNPTISVGNGLTFYVGVFLYSDSTWTTLTDSGTVATAVVQTLTVNAQVAELLQFCVGSTTVNDATTSVASDCSGVSGTALNLGTLDSSTVNISPWSTDGGDSNNGVAMIRTNAQNGATVSYDAVQAATGTNHLGTLRLSGASCNAGTINTDGCINAAGASQTPFNAGAESFGMTIAGVNCGSTDTVNSYACDFSTGTTNLAPGAQYIGSAYTQGTSGTFGTSAAKGFAWQEDGSSVTIASSASSPVKQIDDEALILAFAATPSITTPFGAYSVQVDFTAVPTY